MPTSTHLDDLKINILTESQFDAAVQGGVIGAGEISMITDLDEAIQTDTLPTAAATELGKIYQFTGATGTYTHGYFYECVSDGQNPATYSWTAVQVQASSGGLPSQTGNSGKFLTTDGTDPSWATISALQNTATDATSLGVLATTATLQKDVVIGASTWHSSTNSSDGNSVLIGYHIDQRAQNSADKSVIIGSEAHGSAKSVVIGYQAKPSSSNNYGAESVMIGYRAGSVGSPYDYYASYSVCIGYEVKPRVSYCIAIGYQSEAGSSGSAAAAYAHQIAIGVWAKTDAGGAIQIGRGTNSTEGTLQIGLTVGGLYGTTTQYRLLDSDGTIPADRLPNAINKYSTMPTAASTNEGWIVQYTGTTDASYTHGYIYECVSDGGNPATYSWTAINVQAGGGSTGTTGTLVAADWSSSSQTINVTGVTASNNVIVAAAPASQADYTAAGVICTAQGAGTLTFTCTSTPSTDLTVNVLII